MAARKNRRVATTSHSDSGMRTDVFLYSWPVREKPKLLRPNARMKGPTGVGMAAHSRECPGQHPVLAASILSK